MVVLGLKNARWGYLLLVMGAFAVLVYGVIASYLPVGVLLALLALPLAVSTTTTLFRHYRERSLIKANAHTIMLHVIVGVLIFIGLLVSPQITTAVS